MRHRQGSLVLQVSSSVSEWRCGVADSPLVSELARFAIFRSISPQELESLADRLRPLRCATGAYVIRPDEHASRVFLIRSGGVKVVLGCQSEQPLVLSLLGPGALIGELGSIQLEHGRSAAVMTLEPSELLCLERRDATQYLAQVPQLAHNLVRLLADRLRRTNELLWLREEPSVRRRVAWMLSRLAEDYGEPQIDGALALPFRFVQEDLASLVGTTRPRVNQQLVALEVAGLIGYKQRRYVVRNPGQLWRVAEGVEEPVHNHSP
jgi:CRP/FNR family transcriptional regulator, cyclic AMP receptor protein